jgi:ankyrin repeat protein
LASCSSRSSSGKGKDELQFDAQVLAWLANRTDLNLGIDALGESPLYLAALHGYADSALLLLAHGADPNRTADGTSPLGAAALNISTDEGRALSVVDALVSNGGDVNRKDFNGRSPLHIAAHNGLSRVCEFLIQHGADINDADSIGWTPLHHAAAEGFPDVIDRLIAHGAAVNAVDRTANTPLFWTRKHAADPRYQNKPGSNFSLSATILIQHGAR